MIIPDANLLIYAYNSDAPRHEAAKKWWEHRLNGSEPIGLTSVVIAAFVRISTHRAAMSHPLTTSQAAEIVETWLAQPVVRVIATGADHTACFLKLIRETGVAGNLTTNAQIAAHAIEHQATVHSNDSDFARFAGLRWRDPLKST